MPIEITPETLFLCVVAIAIFFFLQLLWRLYSVMTSTIQAVYEVNLGMTPAQVYSNARVARWNRRILVGLFLLGLGVIFVFFFPDQAALVWSTVKDVFQFVFEQLISVFNNLIN